MKRVIALFLALCCVFSLAACGAAGKSLAQATEAPEEELVVIGPGAEAESPETTPEQPEPAPEPTPEPEPAAEAEALPDEAVSLTLNDQEQYEANIFLSNFSEQNFYGRYPGETFEAEKASEAVLFHFAHLWAKINRQSAISYKDGYEAMTREAVNEITGRFFGQVLDPVSGTDYSEELGIGRFDWNHCWYADGLYYYPAADGESYNRFSVVTEAAELPGQLLRFRFTFYELDLDVYWDNLGIPDAYYWLSPEECRMPGAAEITPVGTGTALCSRCQLMDSGRESYQLISYELDPA